MASSNARRYMRCQARKYQLPCWHLLHSGLPVSGVVPSASAMPCMAARKRHPSGSDGLPFSGSRSSRMRTPFS